MSNGVFLFAQTFVHSGESDKNLTNLIDKCEKPIYNAGIVKILTLKN